MLIFFINLCLMEFQVRYLTLLCLVSVTVGFKEFWMEVFTRIPVNAGVHQVSILGPTLFLLCIKDLPDNVVCNIAIYADDTPLYFKCDKASDLWQQLELAFELGARRGKSFRVCWFFKSSFIVESVWWLQKTKKWHIFWDITNKYDVNKTYEESHVITGGNTKYFKLEKSPRQSDPISAYHSILVLEIVFMSVKENKSIKSLKIFNHTFLCTAYTDNTTFFLKDKESLIEVMKLFDVSSCFSGFNKSKCKVTEISVFCGMKCIDLRLNTLNILVIYFWHDQKIENDENFLKQIFKIKKFQKVWKMRNLTL